MLRGTQKLDLNEEPETRNWELATGTQKRGRRPPPFLAGEVAYRFLPPFFFPPLAVFFAITLIPPFARWLMIAMGSTALRRRCHPGTSARSVGALRLVAKLPPRGRSASKKLGVSPLDTPGPVGGYLTLLPALFLAALRSLLRHYSSLECGSSALLPVTEGYNRWAERSTLIQDVDYG
jgi:hypothetical protein